MKPNVLSILMAARRAQEKGDRQTSERFCRQALAIDPGNTTAALALGTLLSEDSRLQEAIAILNVAARQNLNDPQVLAGLGRCLLLARDPAATGPLERAVALDPKSPAIRRWLAECRLASLRPEEALTLLAPLLASGRADADTRVLAGQACEATHLYPESAEHFKAALATRPLESTHDAYARALRNCGRIDESLAEYDHALARWPSSGPLLGGKCDVQAWAGDYEGALATIQAAHDRGITDHRLALVQARTSKSKEQRGAAIRAVEQALARAGPDQAPRVSLHLALGSLYDLEGLYDKAFECFRAGNDLYPRRYDPAADERAARTVFEVYSAENLSRMVRGSDADPVPVFLVGMARSGSSLLEQILASHPAVHGAGELADLPNLSREIPRLVGLRPTDDPSCVLSMQQSHADALARTYLDHLHALGPGAQRVTDKGLLNYRFLGLIGALLPGARVVHCVRNPLDTCLSCYMTDLGLGHPYKCRLSDLAGAYRVYRDTMAHWKKVLRVPILDVVYEELIADPPTQVRRLVDFVGLPWDDRCLTPHKNRRVVRTASIDQVRRPIYDSSIGRWKHYERHLAELIDGLRDFL